MCKLGGARLYLVRSDENGAESARRVEILAGRPLPGAALIVAHGRVVESGIAEHMVKRVGSLDVASALADHHRQFGLVVQEEAPDRRGLMIASPWPTSVELTRRKSAG